MKVLKFGGTSVGKPERMHHVASLISAHKEAKIVVLSAISGTTNTLVEISACLAKKEKSKAKGIIENLNTHYRKFIDQLFKEKSSIEKGIEIVNDHFKFINNQLEKHFSLQLEKELLAQGELLSTKLFGVYLQEADIEAQVIFALDFMSVDENHEPQLSDIEERLSSIIADNDKTDLFITQGYICRNSQGQIDNLKRGGSDYAATIIGAAIRATEVQIWTDIDGMHNNDPRIVEKTFPVAELSFDEAAELSYFGAKILHPTCIWPAQKFNVPVRILNTMQPNAVGTYISDKKTNEQIKAIAAKDDIFAIKIKSSRMLLAYGFLRKVFEIFEKYKTPIDMITTSEVAISLTIDDGTNLKAIVDELQQFGSVEVDKEQTIICIVGSQVSENKGIPRKLFDTMDQIPIRMISYGGSRNNISLLIDKKYKKAALDRLNVGLFSIDLI